MKQIDDLYKKITVLNESVKKDLKKQGFIVPIQLSDGSIKIEHYIIKKNKKGFFEIKNNQNSYYLDRINLAQTAIILANKLALGKWLDTDVLNLDRKYGYAVFDEEVSLKSKYNCLKSKNFDKFDVMTNKIAKAQAKKEYLKKCIDDNFHKLLNFR